MDTLRTPAAVATLIATHIAPLVGIVGLGWSPTSLLVLYLIDTLLALGAVVLLVMAHVTGNDEGKPLSGWKDWTKALVGLGILGAIFAFPISLPIFFAVGDDGAGIEALFRDPGFLAAIAVQVAASGYAVVRQHRELKRRSDDDRVLAGRLFFLVARWMVMFVAVVTGAITLLGPAIGGFLLVAVYAGASIYFELFPERAQRFIRGGSAKPIVWEGDLDGQNAKREAATLARKSKR
jgi:hypothetical protein